MKKIISLCLAVALLMSLSITVFAENQTDVGVGNYSTTVTGSTVNGTVGGTVFMVDISWSGMDFTYHGEKAPTWDAENHTYTDRVAAWWEGQGTISVTNDSNARIYAAPVYEAAAGYESADMAFSTEKLQVATAAYGTQQSGTITVTPTGSLPNDTQNKTIGTITITIAEDPDVTVAEAFLFNDVFYALYNEIHNSVYVDSRNEKYNDELFNMYTAGATANAILQSSAHAFQEGGYSQARLNSDYATAVNYYYNMQAKFNALKDMG